MSESLELEIEPNETTSIPLHEVNTTVVESKQGKHIDLAGGISFGIGTIIGSGIFMTVGDAYKVFKPNNLLFVLIFWLSVGIISLMGGLCYAELGTRFPQSGGERIYLGKAWGDKMSITYIVMYVFILKVFAMSSLAVAGGQYFASIIEVDKDYVKILVALIILIMCCVVNCLSKKVVTKLGMILTAMKIYALCVIIFTGIHYIVNGSAVLEFTWSFEGYTAKSIINCIVSLAWTYEGINVIACIAGDMKNPKKDLPKSIIISQIVVIVIYSLTAVSYPLVIGYNAAKNEKNLATLLSRHAFGPLFFVLPILVIFSCTGAVLGTLYGISNACLASVANNEIPSIFGLVHRKTRTAIVSNIILTVLSICFIFIPFETLLKYTSVLSWMIYLTTFISLIKFKVTTRNLILNNVFQIHYIIIIMMILFSIFIIFGCIYLETQGTLIFVAITILVYFIQYVPSRHLPVENMKEFQNRIIAKMQRYVDLEIAGLMDVS